MPSRVEPNMKVITTRTNPLFYKPGSGQDEKDTVADPDVNLPGYITVNSKTVREVKAGSNPQRRRMLMIGAVIIVGVAVAAVGLAFGTGMVGGGNDGGNAAAAEGGDNSGSPGTGASGGDSGAPTDPSVTAGGTSVPTMIPSTAPTVAPSLAPTTAVTAEPVTPMPTASPTVTSITLTTATPTTISPGSYKLLPSGIGELLRLTRTQLPNGPTLLAGRSYDGGSWESAPPIRQQMACGADAGSLVPMAIIGTEASNRAENNCSVHVPAHAGYRWQIETGNFTDTASARASAARFLIKSTWGPKRDTIDELLAHNGNLASWIAAETAKPATLHRAYLRSRVNPQDIATADGQSMLHLPVGVRATCSAGSRWSRYTLSSSDIGRQITLSQNGANSTMVTVNGIPRTVASADMFSEVGSTGTWLVCRVEQRVGGDVLVANSTVCPNRQTGGLPRISNPAVAQPPTTRTVLITNNSSRLVNLRPAVDDAKLLADGVPTSELNCTAAPHYGPLFAMVNGVGYINDPRVNLVGNTLESPARATEYHPIVRSNCPTVTKTFLNSHTCVTGVDTCAPLQFETTFVVLNESFLERLWEVGGKSVYSVTGLRLDGANSPCTSETTRWVKREGTACSNPGLDAGVIAATQHRVAAAMAAPSADDNPFVRDIQLGPDANCSHSSVAGVSVLVNGSCWQHSHPDELNVIDFTTWTRIHPGGAAAILQFARSGNFSLQFPSWHDMARWSTNYGKSSNGLTKLGRLGDSVDFANFPTSLLLEPLANEIGATRANDVAHEVCGSPGEVDNAAFEGHMFRYGIGDSVQNGHRQQVLDRPNNFGPQRTKDVVWTSATLRAHDQLRQRVAWALSQIFVVNEDGAGSTDTSEMYATYYDIFVRNAFGNYRDILKEVSYSVVMEKMLTFLNTRSYASSGVAPDENYAREVCQLFTMGLWMLHPNGTKVTDANENPIPTYTIEDIATMARVWTGFRASSPRGNIEHVSNQGTNNIDPAQLVSSWRDQNPKVVPSGGYLGDRYPLCTDLPRRAFLRPGAKYVYLGSSPRALKQLPAFSDNHTYRTVNLNISSSLLATTLCRSGGGAVGTPCKFKSVVVLQSILQCNGQECRVDAPRVANVNGTFYEYIRQPCVHTAFFINPTLVTNQFGMEMRRSPLPLCADRHAQAAGIACCDANATGSRSRTARAEFEYTGDLVTFATAEQRCASLGRQMCPFTRIRGSDPGWWGASRFWQPSNQNCQLQVQIRSGGEIAVVDDIPGGGTPEFAINNRHRFRVEWNHAAYPTVTHGCCGGGSIVSGTCLCDVNVTNEAVFTSASPSREEVLTALQVGAIDPTHFDTGTFTRCNLAICTRFSDVVVWLRNSSSGSIIDKDTIFELTPSPGWSGPRFFRNMMSTVHIVGTNHSFRNPVAFHAKFESATRDAEHETDAMITYLLEHSSTAPFVANLFIQRFVTSNPSPRYVESVATAFATGRFREFGRGVRGDLNATIAAVLLDREATSAVLDNDPNHGKVREPVIKMMHILRALEFEPPSNEPRLFDPYLDTSKIGQRVWDAPSVFNFFQLDFIPEGSLASADLVAPEAALLTAPLILDFVNSIQSTLRWGLSSCDSGLSVLPPDSRCRGSNLPNVGNLTFTPAGYTAASIVSELSVLLTGDKLAAHTASIMSDAYNIEFSKSGDTHAALRVVYQLFAAASEFHVLGNNKLTSRVRAPDVLGDIIAEYNCHSDCSALGQANAECSVCGARRKCCRLGYGSGLNSTYCGATEGCSGRHCCVESTSITSTAPTPAPRVQTRRPYKAIVLLFLGGGCDSFNMLVPHSNCTGGGYAQYANVRQDVALPKSSLLTINASIKSPNSTQPCDVFGVNSVMQNIHRLYNAGDALFVANTGTLVEPLTKAEYLSKTKARPPQLFAHNTQQNLGQTLDTSNPQQTSGVLGRMVDSLRNRGTRCGMYSINGAQKAVTPKTSETYDIVSSKGVKQISANARSLLPSIINMSNYISESLYSETWSSQLESALYRTTLLGSALDEVTLNTSFQTCATSGKVACQLKQVAKLIHANRDVFQNERDVFFVQMGGFDVHSNAIEGLAETLRTVDGAIADFESEMRTLGLWENVTIVETSDFARTLTSNGGGTDHAWGGNTFVAGGSVRGGQIVGEFPSDLSESGPQSINRGRLIPTTPLDSIWNSVSAWFGIDSRDMDAVLPKKRNFPSLFDKDVLFDLE